MSGGSEFIADLVDALAEYDDVEARELQYSLHDHVDTEALRSLSESEHTDWSLRFRVPDHDVTVHGDGEVLIGGEQVREPER